MGLFQAFHAQVRRQVMPLVCCVSTRLPIWKASIRQRGTSIGVPILVLALVYVGVWIALVLLGSTGLLMAVLTSGIAALFQESWNLVPFSLSAAALIALPLSLAVFSPGYQLWQNYQGSWVARALAVMGVGVRWPRYWFQ